MCVCRLPFPEFASTLLVSLDVEVKSLVECNDLYSAAEDVFLVKYPQGLDDTLLCAGGGTGKDVCRVRNREL